jgi:molybdopterin-biosynthesis enzyme MoeA-like protein
MNNLDPFKADKNKKKKSAKQAKNFIEAFRELGSGMAKSARQDVAKGLGKTLAKQLRRPAVNQPQKAEGQLQDGQPINIEAMLTQQEQRVRSEERAFAQQQRREELTVYSAKEQKVQQEVKMLQAELKKLSQQTKNFEKEAEKAAFNTVVSPGTYHVNFFEKLIKIVAQLKEQVCESQLWLKTFNQRAQKKGFYWRQVKKSGTKFMLSSERYMATQAG